MHQRALDFYTAPGHHTTLAPGDFSSRDIHEVVDVVQGLLVYDLVADSFYGVVLDERRAGTIHERDTARLLDVVRAVDPRPLREPRPPESRVGARCNAFSRLTVAFLRAAGVPARARCGFSSYFRPGWLEDHWVAEYWNDAVGRWEMVDAQLDAIWREKIAFEGDSFALSPSEFIPAGRAWRAWRQGQLDASRCGLSTINEHGAHWIAGNLRLDLASLNKVEMLPWDVWGTRWGPGEAPPIHALEAFDAAAAITVDPDWQLDELHRRFEVDGALHMDGEVFNAERGVMETV
ncbi:transglutaminase domain-containing protein [Microbacterium resistens]|uniref:transglutaminase domain-containing protein n=1 Tax=Microbacterium resistens TaxID=156977 RepID=UPI001C564A8C|nr:transglutaminase domain-containing protein [Microbacterium resistens]MBW1638008.1 transglutaminase domain-containing protein [Microbacterium resistens]